MPNGPCNITHIAHPVFAARNNFTDTTKQIMNAAIEIAMKHFTALPHSYRAGGILSPNHPQNS